ncbi:DUF4116 domain-containing protein [Lachnospiraceae bacterium YH-ros2228]
MVLFNGEAQKYTPKHIKNDNIVIDILSDRLLEEVLGFIEQGEPLPEGTTVKAFHRSDQEPHYDIDNPILEDGVLYDNTYLTEEDLIEMDDDFYEEPDLLTRYRPFRNGVLERQHSFSSFTPEKKTLTDEIQDALGILPTLMNVSEPIRERIRLSQVGNDLFWHFNDDEGRISSKNRYPDVDTIRYYDKFTPYEKRIVTEGHIHPRKFVELKRKIEEERPGYILTKQAFDLMKDKESNYYISGTTPIVTVGSSLSLEDVRRALLYPSMEVQHANEMDECVNKADAEFKRIIGRSPRVLREYVVSHCMREGHVLSDDEIRKMVADFSLPSLSKVARMHNFALYALADKIRFQETPKEHIEAFATFLDPNKINLYEKRGFFTWYNAHKDMKTAELMTVMESIDDIKEFGENKSVTELIYDIRQNRGKQDAERFKNSYRIDFADTDLSIRGRNIEVTDGKYTILMLDAKDYRNLLVGYDTHCCQRFDEAGESCVRDIITSPTSGITAIVRNRDMKDGQWVSGKCLAQAYTWVNEEHSTIVFDNMEFADDRKVSEFSDLIAMWAERMPYQNVHVGTGYNQGMTGWGIRVPKTVAKPTLYDGDSLYSDYHENARALKNNGAMMLAIKHPEKLHVSERALIPSRYDLLMKPELAWLSHVVMPLPSRLHLGQAFLSDPDNKDIQMRAVRLNGEAIKFIEHPDLTVQQEIVRCHPELIPSIQNPDPSIYNILLEQNPRAILTMAHPSKEAWQIALSRNGLLLKNCPYRDKDLVLSAVRQNGIAIQFAGNLQNDPEVQMEAVEQNSIAYKHIQNPTEEVTILAAEKNIDNISKETDLPILMQRELVEDNPTNILNFKDKADPSVVLLALSKNGLLLRNFRQADEEMQMTAVQNNGLAIRYIRTPSMDLLKAAYESNPRSLRYMRITPNQKAELLREVEEGEELSR